MDDQAETETSCHPGVDIDPTQYMSGELQPLPPGSVGRPTKYNPALLPQITNLAKLGWLNKEIAIWMGVDITTFCDYQNQFPQFSEALKKGREIVNIKVANALLKRAIGFDYDEVVEEFVEVDGQPQATATGEIVPGPKITVLTNRKVTTKKVLGDVAAQKFWLQNREKDHWTEGDGTKAVNNIQLNVVYRGPDDADNADNPSEFTVDLSDQPADD